jgi:FtsH-binding integral membrane protein
MQDFTKPPQFGGQPNGWQSEPVPLALTSEAVFFQKVYAWMCGALVVTAVTGYLLAQSQGWRTFISGGTMVWIGIIVVQLGLVMAISFLLNKISAFAVKTLFVLYAVSVGFTMSLVLLVYPPAIIFKAFISTAAVYGAMAVYGLVTKRSLQGMGSFLFMGLVGVIIASLVNVFARSTAMDFVICVVGVLIFAGLTAYDHQKLRVIHAGGFGDEEAESKAVSLGALNLYLDFINIFLFLVRLFGRSE